MSGGRDGTSTGADSVTLGADLVADADDTVAAGEVPTDSNEEFRICSITLTLASNPTIRIFDA